ncbi:MAG: patatin-like phospholipase family protein [Syntrophaceticus schinkii]|nr:patatin-like phospholipase family protein [Syntrophaceticus schinkii]
MYGIILEGGGARGAYQVGVWKALRKLGIDYCGVAGTSVGALNGAMMVQGDFDQALDVWSDITPSKIVSIDDELYEKIKNLEISADITSDILQYIKSIFHNRGMDTTPLHNLLCQCLDETKIRQAGIEFGIITISLSDLTPLKLFLQDIPQGKLIDYLLASASLPVFQRQRIGNKSFLDGGVYDNLPISLLAQKGFQKIIAVRLVQKGIKKSEKEKGLSITLIKPCENLGSMFDFTRERAQTNIELGYYDTLKVFKRFHGIRYCVDVNRDEEYFLKLLLQMNQTKLEGLRQELGAPDGMPHRRFILERLVPLLVELLPVTQCVSYGELTVALLERAADKVGIERFTVHSYDSFEQEVVKAHQPEGRNVNLPAVLKGSELLLRAKKEPLLDDIADALIGGIKQG